ncbi:hypothetical protein QBC34DRAFT_64885 [Podospora aff. communis PSN243]|uniref:Uncharacterized protein n=1 Tax=Podospora aff. communis PSN243 TaxID=3040156 RepID=A0AAV9GS24_9PEZI|nr:hypothetical protein QBC34DRAFT_64885 [Podospora aff. communis PSN243]
MSSQRYVPAPTARRRRRSSHHRLSSFTDLNPNPKEEPPNFEANLAQAPTTSGQELQPHQPGPPPHLLESATDRPHFRHTQLEVTQTESTKAHAEQRYLELTRLELLPDQNLTQPSAFPVLPSAELAAAFTGNSNMAAPSPIYVILLNAPPGAPAAPAAIPGTPQTVLMLTPTGLVPIPGGITAAAVPPPAAPALVLQLAPAAPPPPTQAVVLQLAPPPAPPPPQPVIVLQLAPPAPPAPPAPAFMIACAAPAPPAPPPAPLHIRLQ